MSPSWDPAIVQKPEWVKTEGVPVTPPAMSLQPSFFLILYLFALHVAAWDCTALQSLNLPNVSIANAVYLAPGTTFNASADPTCFESTYNNTVAVCRVSGTITTSSTSSVAFEMWLPDTWYGRVLTGGNGGLGGCKHFLFHLPPRHLDRFRLTIRLFFHC